MVQRYERFSSAVSRISYCIQKIETEVMSKYGLAGACAQYLAALGGSEGGLTVSALSKACMKDKAAVSRAVSQMEEKGFVCRNSSGGNMYRAPIVLTEKGKEVSAYVARRASSAVEIAGLKDADREKFYAALKLIADNLTQMCEGGFRE